MSTAGSACGRCRTGRPHIAIVRGECEWDEGKLLLERESVCLIRNQDQCRTRRWKSCGTSTGMRIPSIMSMKARWLMEHKLEPLQHPECGGPFHLRGHGQGRSGLEHRAGDLPLLLRRHLPSRSSLRMARRSPAPPTCSTAGGKRSCPRYGQFIQTVCERENIPSPVPRV